VMGRSSPHTVRKAPALHLVGIPKPFPALHEIGTRFARIKQTER